MVFWCMYFPIYMCYSYLHNIFPIFIWPLGTMFFMFFCWLHLMFISMIFSITHLLQHYYHKIEKTKIPLIQIFFTYSYWISGETSSLDKTIICFNLTGICFWINVSILMFYRYWEAIFKSLCQFNFFSEYYFFTCRLIYLLNFSLPSPFHNTFCLFCARDSILKACKTS